jgi:hypothetical protein
MKKLENLNEKKLTKLEEDKILTNTKINEIGLFEKKPINNELVGREDNVQKDAECIFSTPQLKEQNEDQELKCKFAAIVMDRFFFFVSLFYAIITFVSLIMSIPNFYK